MRQLNDIFFSLRIHPEQSYVLNDIGIRKANRQMQGNVRLCVSIILNARFVYSNSEFLKFIEFKHTYTKHLFRFDYTHSMLSACENALSIHVSLLKSQCVHLIENKINFINKQQIYEHRAQLFSIVRNQIEIFSPHNSLYASR